MRIKKLFSSHGKADIKPHFNFSQSGNIWRLYFNQNNIMAGETRDLENKQAYIFSLNYINKKIYLKNFQFDEKWWFAIDGINDKNIFVSNFIHPEMPEHKGFTTIDIKTGKKLWGNGNLEFYFTNNTELYAIKQLFESKIIYKINTENGEIINEYKSDDEINSIITLKNENDIYNYENLLNTVVLNLDDEHYKSEFDIIISKLKSIELQGNIEFIQTDRFIIYNYHSNKGINPKNINESLLTNKLEIFEREPGTMVYNDILNKETSSYVPDSFFVLANPNTPMNNFLFYIKEKKELICIELK